MTTPVSVSVVFVSYVGRSKLDDLRERDGIGPVLVDKFNVFRAFVAVLLMNGTSPCDKQKTASRRSLRNPIKLFYQAVA
jgi:hypothetical protein